MKKYFIIESRGRTATQWLAKVLNRHPEMFCAHSADLNPFSDEGPERFARIHEEMLTFSEMKLDDYFDLLERGTDAKVVGSLHAYNLVDIFPFPFRFRRRFHLSVMLRNPIDRVESFVSRMKKEIQMNEESLETYRFMFNACSPLLTHIGDLAKGVDFSDQENFLFVNSVYNTLSADELTAHMNVDCFLFERMVSEIDYLVMMINKLSGGSIVLERDYISDVIKISPFDQLVGSMSSFEKFMAWAPWKQALFAKLVSIRRLEVFYRNKGYDFSYVFNG